MPTTRSSSVSTVAATSRRSAPRRVRGEPCISHSRRACNRRGSGGRPGPARGADSRPSQRDLHPVMEDGHVDHVRSGTYSKADGGWIGGAASGPCGIFGTVLPGPLMDRSQRDRWSHRLRAVQPPPLPRLRTRHLLPLLASGAASHLVVGFALGIALVSARPRRHEEPGWPGRAGPAVVRRGCGAWSRRRRRCHARPGTGSRPMPGRARRSATAATLGFGPRSPTCRTSTEPGRRTRQ